jgi:hypothetical protein
MRSSAGAIVTLEISDVAAATLATFCVEEESRPGRFDGADIARFFASGFGARGAVLAGLSSDETRFLSSRAAAGGLNDDARTAVTRKAEQVEGTASRLREACRFTGRSMQGIFIVSSYLPEWVQKEYLQLVCQPALPEPELLMRLVSPQH